MSLFADSATGRRFNRMQWRMLFATMIGYTLFACLWRTRAHAYGEE